MKCTTIEKLIMDKTEIQYKSRKRLKEYQLHKIKETIAYVKENSKFYREYLKDIKAEYINSFKDFKNVPFTNSKDIIQNPFRFLCVPQKNIKRVVTLKTSGTTGYEKRIYFTEKDLELTVDFFSYGMKSLVDEGDRILVMFPGNSYGSIGYLLKRALEKINIYCYVQGIMKNTSDTADIIKNKHINCIVGIPIQLLQFSRSQSSIFKDRIDKILLSSDYVPETLVNEMTDKFKTKVFTHYGMTEMGYGGAVQCETLNGYHLRENDIYFEIVDPTTGREVKYGEPGEVVFTTLKSEGMPLIRYKTGDIASFSKNCCKCGSFLKTMNKVLGRIDNRFEISSHKYIYMSQLDEIILSFPQVMNYSLHIEDYNKIYVYLTLFNQCDFNKLSLEILKGIKNITFIEDELLNNIIEFKIINSTEDKQIKNSMLKRKIYDNRKKVYL
ncbi:AMP-binding protein [Clostridium tyrobutyricum]|uniref:DVU_1553 family AMP-dependent CoA ligase n=1 Tax=Clostridium tyrobutyricum TaxID=1519 RepID=UPI001C393432|nr:AMP-binding protein [Clostridium tyrobutyricum]MBV4432672.1 AMP-binding protein [Clostridium tyrobutyricum]